MTTPGVRSPNTDNYLIGKGICLFKLDGADEFRHMGNVNSLEITPAVEKFEHFSSMEGTKTKDLTLVLSKSGEIKIVMEEATAENIAMLMLGDVDESAYGTGTTIDLFSRSSLTGAFRFYGNNDQGPRWFIDIPRVTFNPSGAFSPISEELAQMEVTGDWEVKDGDWGTMTLLAQAGTEAPENVLAPDIVGEAQVGEEL